MTNPRPEPVPIAKLSNLRMAAGNEKKYTFVIHNGILKHWVAIGWIDIGPATPEAYKHYPEVIE